ncbi:MAG: hypothetical protein VKK59_07970, partial [Vampirovibrionales bacterium]|nr:hypothetical protein [Vampirovibrionales bacterium]
MANPKGLSPETARKIRLWLVSFRNTRVILVLAIAVIMAYGTWDMVFTPKFAELQGLSQQLESQQQQVNLVNATEETIKRARKELADFKQIIPDVKMGESPQVVSVSLNK